MTRSDHFSASEALIDWFQSQGIGPQDACVVMSYTTASIIAAAFKTEPACDDMLIKFHSMLRASTAAMRAKL